MSVRDSNDQLVAQAWGCTTLLDKEFLAGSCANVNEQIQPKPDNSPGIAPANMYPNGLGKNQGTAHERPSP
jgi:hypothetical protein